VSSLALPTNSAAPNRERARVRFGRVEDGRGSLGPMANAPFPIPARQTGRADFRHPAFRLASPQAHDGRPLIAGVGRRHLGTGRSSSSSRAFSEGSGFLSGVVRLITNQIHLSIFKSAPEVGALCSTGITRHQRSYCPVRLPP
jgi:hypothetical protein